MVRRPGKPRALPRRPLYGVAAMRLSYLLSLTPLETWRLARHRLPGLKGGPAWTPSELLSSAKHGRGIRFAELLLRQEAVVRRAMPWEPLDFAGAPRCRSRLRPARGFRAAGDVLRRRVVRKRRAGMGSRALLQRRGRVDRYLAHLSCRSCARFTGHAWILPAFLDGAEGAHAHPPLRLRIGADRRHGRYRAVAVVP